MGVNKIINSPVVNKLKICDLKSSRFLKYTAIIIITITTRVTLYINVFTCFFESFIRNFQASKSTFATDIQSRFSTLHTVNLFIINYRYNFLHYSVKTFSYKQQVINKSYNLLMQMWRTWFVSVFITKPLIWTIRKGIPLMSTALLEAVVIQEIIIVN